MAEGEQNFEQEPRSGNIIIKPAEAGLGTKNFLVIEGDMPTLEEIIHAAARNEAKLADHDEAGDDQYAVQFPGHEPELLDQDGISGRLREQSGEKW